MWHTVVSMVPGDRVLASALKDNSVIIPSSFDSQYLRIIIVAGCKFFLMFSSPRSSNQYSRAPIQIQAPIFLILPGMPQSGALQETGPYTGSYFFYQDISLARVFFISAVSCSVLRRGESRATRDSASMIDLNWPTIAPREPPTKPACVVGAIR